MKTLRVVPALHRATHRVGLYLRSRVPQVSQAEAHLLTHLHESGGKSTIAELHRAWAHRRSTLTDILDRLEERGLARRSVLPTDRRSVLVSLTAKGRRLGATVHEQLELLEAAVVEALGRTAGQGLDLLAALERVANRMVTETTR